LEATSLFLFRKEILTDVVSNRCYCRPDTSGINHMFLLKVILGTMEQGSPGMDLPSNPDLYDTAANNLPNPNEIIVWTPYLYSRILIEYVISFRM
jgi:hypothetical protein